MAQRPRVDKPTTPAHAPEKNLFSEFGNFLGDVGKNLFSPPGKKSIFGNLTGTEYANRSMGGTPQGAALGVMNQLTGKQDNTPVDAGNVPNTSKAGIWDYQYNKALGPYRSSHYTTDQPEAAPSYKGYGDFIQAAQDLLNKFGLGGGGAARVNFDPQRQAARSQWADADARTAAMYRQLQDSISGDAPGIQQNYEGAIKANDQRTQDTSAGIEGAYNRADDEAARMAQALGIQQAVGNSIQQGNFGGLDRANAVSGATQRGQIAATQYGTNEQSALDANRTTAQAAGLAGANTRAVRQNELSRILAGIDASEQNANLQAQSQAQGNREHEILSLADQLFGGSTETQQYADKMNMQAINAANKAPQPRMDINTAMALANKILGISSDNPLDTKDPNATDAYRKFIGTIMGN